LQADQNNVHAQLSLIGLKIDHVLKGLLSCDFDICDSVILCVFYSRTFFMVTLLVQAVTV